jgi:4-carboxymuconolactone decarboxylase
MNDDRFARGLQRLHEIDPRMADQLAAKLGDIAPDLERYVIEFAFGDVHSRPGLGAREREIATVAALTALGTAEHQLRVHIAAALNAGVTHAEVIEVIIQMAVYAGFPAALNGIVAARKAFADHEEQSAGR